MTDQRPPDEPTTPPGPAETPAAATSPPAEPAASAAEPVGPPSAPAALAPGADGLPPAAYPAGAVPPRPRGGVTVPVAVPVVVALVLGLLLGLVLGWLLPRPGSGDQVAAAPSETATATPTAAALSPAAPQPIGGGPTGSEQVAGLVLGTQGPLVELFEDYVCPFCARLEASSGARLRQAALDGEYRLVVHPIAFLTEDSPRAANASACVYQHADAATWVAFHESVYAQQDPSETVGQFSDEVLLQLATAAGATAPEVAGCIQGGTYEQWVGALTEQAFQRGVRGTPTLAVEGTVTDVSALVE